jgi:hypothetical protein
MQGEELVIHYDAKRLVTVENLSFSLPTLEDRVGRTMLAYTKPNVYGQRAGDYRTIACNRTDSQYKNKRRRIVERRQNETIVVFENWIPN